MAEQINYYWDSMMEPQNFPGWEVYIVFQTMLWISVIIRLRRIESKLDPLTRKEIDLLINGYDTPDRKRNIKKSMLWWVRKQQMLDEEEG